LATIPNALRQCPVFANNHSFRSVQGFERRYAHDLAMSDNVIRYLR
jgi:hypothetical protein